MPSILAAFSRFPSQRARAFRMLSFSFSSRLTPPTPETDVPSSACFTKRGTSEASIFPSLSRTTMLSTQFLNSRTLPGQS